MLSFSCKKGNFLQENKLADSLRGDVNHVQNSVENGYEVGGTIGCVINLTNPSSSGYRDNDAYDSCMDGVLKGSNMMGNIKIPGTPPVYPAPECLPCMVPSQDKVDLMAHYWSLLGVTLPQTEQEYEVIRQKLAVYNAVIMAVFTNTDGNLDVPEDRLFRLSQLMDYSGTLPIGIVDYVSFAYGKYFSIDPAIGAKLFKVYDANGFEISYKSYGVKVGEVAVNL